MMRTPAATAASMAAKTVSQALPLIAWLIPETCSMRVPRITSSGSVDGSILDAADPRRR